MIGTDYRERFDILDRAGWKTGETAVKGTELSDGQFCLGVHAYVYNAAGQLLIQRRAFCKTFLPGGWDVHLGHVIAGESSREGIVRELQEELDLTVSPEDLALVCRIPWFPEYHHLVDVYFIRMEFDIHTLKLQPDEVIDVKAVSAADMLSMIKAMTYRPAAYRQAVAEEIKKRMGILSAQPSK